MTRKRRPQPGRTCVFCPRPTTDRVDMIPVCRRCQRERPEYEPAGAGHGPRRVVWISCEQCGELTTARTPAGDAVCDGCQGDTGTHSHSAAS